MPQDIITFEKGMFPQLDQTIKIEGTYLDALNMMRDESSSLFNEIGSSMVKMLPSGFIFIGQYILGDIIILASTNGTLSTIATLSADDVYTEVLSNEILGFKKTNRVEIEGRFNHRGDMLIYVVGDGIIPRRINLDKIPSITDFDKLTNMFLEFNLPKVGLSSVFSGAKVLSGAYQFAARLVTASNNVTGFGPISGVIPIGVGNIDGNRRDYNGGPPQTLTPNGIALNISNIDETFEYVEIAVITYIGDGNTIRIRSLDKIPISGKSGTAIFAGPDSEKGIILEGELAVDAINYSSVSHIIQKDSTLILAGLSETIDEVNWQQIANKIKVRYIEHNLPFKEAISIENDEGETLEDKFNEYGYYSTGLGVGPWKETAVASSMLDYKSPKVCEKFMSYKRGEVYSFTITPIYTSGRKGDAYHIIPNGPKTPVAGSTELGYVEVEGITYPDSSDYEEYRGVNVRYHKMPTTEQSNFYVESSGSKFIVALGLEFEVPDGEWKTGVSGYIIGRESRKGKETIIAQGIIKNFYRPENGEGKNVEGIAAIPGFGRLQIRGTEANFNNVDRIEKNAFMFNSPDLLTDQIEFVPHKLRRVSIMTGTVKFANTTGTGYRQDVNCANFVDAVPKTFVNEECGLADGLKTTILSESLDHGKDVSHVGTEYDIVKTILGGYKFMFRRILETTAMKASVDITTMEPFEFIDYFQDRDENRPRRFEYSFIDKPRANKGVIEYDLGLYEVLRDNKTYYGGIFDKESMPISTIIFNKPQVDPRTNDSISHYKPICFGGDTFISKYAMMFKDTMPYAGGTIGKYQDVAKVSTIVYFFLESQNNYNYRHYIQESDEEGTLNTMPFYPQYRMLWNMTSGILDYPVSLGHSILYNKQYSAQNNLQMNVTKSIDSEVISKFENRAAYSAISIEGERFDAYTLFLASNIHDIPKQFGTITSMFTQGNELYFHTTRSLWRSFYNTLATQATSEGDIVLGNGGAFPRPSVPIITVNGGYAGCLNKEASVSTPIGHVFFDANSSKIFILGEGLVEISNPAIFTLLRELAHKDSEAAIGYDTGRKRLILSTIGCTVSHRPDLSSFDSRHSYTFNNMISRNTSDYLIKGGLLHKFDTNKVGDVLGVRSNSMVKLHSVVHPSLSKRYNSVEAVLSSMHPFTKLHLPFEFFETFKAYSHERHTGDNIFRMMSKEEDFSFDLEQLGVIFVYRANSKFRFAVPPDIVHDINVRNIDPVNWITHPRFTDEDRVFLPNMVDNHMVFELGIDNIYKQKHMKINSFIVNFEQNIT